MQNWKLPLANSLALVAGAIAVAGFAPHHWFALSLISCVIIYKLVMTYPSQVVKLQFFYGLGFFGLGISWVYNSVYEFGTPNIVVASIITLGLIVLMATMWIIPWYFWKRYLVTQSVQRLSPYSFASILCFASIWILAEWTRSWLLSGFPWLFLGYGTIDSVIGSTIKLWAPWLGVYGVSFVSVTIALLWLKIIIERTNKLLFDKLKPIALLLFLILFPLALPEQTTANTNDKNSIPIDFALVQPNTSQHQKWLPQYRESIIQNLLNLSAPYWEKEPTLIIWPEASIPVALPKEQLVIGVTESINQSLLTSNSTLLMGVPTYDSATNNYFNSFIQLGKTIDYYDKVHLVPFGEYIPFQSILNSLLSVFDLPLPSQQSGSDTHKHFKLDVTGNAINIAPNICYEVAFPDLIAKQAIDANLLITISNDAWFGDSWGPIQHLQMAQMRALENAKPMLRTTSTGITASIDHKGDIIQQLPQFLESVLTGQVQPRDGNTLFSQTGSIPILILCVAIVLWFSRKFIWAPRPKLNE